MISKVNMCGFYIIFTKILDEDNYKIDGVPL